MKSAEPRNPGVAKRILAGIFAEARSMPEPAPEPVNPEAAGRAAPRQMWRGRVIDQSAHEALQAEIAERARAEAELRRSEAELAVAQKIARVGSWSWDTAAEKMTWSAENYRLHGFEPGAVEPSPETALGGVHPDDRELSQGLFKTAVREGTSFGFEQRLRLPDGSERILQQRGEAVRDESGAVVKVFGTAQDITERKHAEQELERVHSELVEVSRHAGMAEVATGVLHNVGNVLNSVNVSAMLISERLGKSRITHLNSVCELLRAHESDLGAFFESDPRGRKLPAFLDTLAERLTVEQGELVREVEGLAKNIAHIKEIVATQQSYAKVSGMTEALSAPELVEDALEMNGAAFVRHQVELTRDFAPAPLVRVDKHKVLQILINVLRNAKYAVSESLRPDKRIDVRIRPTGAGTVEIIVEDNGIGIAPENLSRIFAHGFTTKSAGHGFGLHSAALAAKEMSGSLLAQSEGTGRGAIFTLTLPVEPESAA